MAPGHEVGTKGNVYDIFNSHGLKASEDAFIFIRIIGQKCGSDQKGYIAANAVFICI